MGEDDLDSLEEEEELAPPPRRKKKKKKKKDPNAPKRNMSAFFLYSNANRTRVKQENPEAKFGDLAKIMSVEFKAISAADRAKRNQSSFFLYSNATRNDVKAANPEAKFGEIAQIISRHFKALPGEERAYWDEKAAEDKERYLTQKASYEQTGTF